MDQITNIRDGLARLSTALETIATTNTPAVPDATVNSISGNAIHGGKITLLRSTGIRDQASRTSLLVEDDKITVGTADIDNISGDLHVENDLVIGGEIKADTLRVSETYTDQKHTSSIDFQVEGDTRLIGLQWRKQGEATKQLVWRDDRFYISKNITIIIPPFFMSFLIKFSNLHLVLHLLNFYKFSQIHSYKLYSFLLFL